MNRNYPAFYQTNREDRDMRVSDLNTGLSSWFELMADAVLSGATEIGLPKLLMYYPDAKFNPFQQLLYSQASEYNFATIR